MNILYLLIPLALVLTLSSVAAFIWAVRRGQLDDLDTPALRPLLDDEPEPPRR
ncbi:cbb3-type cytochrome oxidase assembly protein CcoS [Lujinxingia vulgaris]|uniref:Cbb3-type cytochrome oxidase assembly protein CcoS n=1 Tax=Lujinxingia vulgaris TaxID=2600176 RepID=A0A5C6XEE0_9DELT|nr:cbb3-type cytochrome oxidase assembly protein CcoS [Lujinxingia vulgaris]TXD35502.1 cbb3-type cytochrome oxidase assembly protein CcoS [Lujinxingia vulgaris]